MTIRPELGFDILGSTLVWERILVVITEDWFALSHFQPLLRELRNLAKEVVVVTRSSGRLEEQALGVRTCNFDLRLGSFNPLSQSKVIRGLSKIIDEERPDAVHGIALQPMRHVGRVEQSA